MGCVRVPTSNDDAGVDRAACGCGGCLVGVPGRGVMSSRTCRVMQMCGAACDVRVTGGAARVSIAATNAEGMESPPAGARARARARTASARVVMTRAMTTRAARAHDVPVVQAPRPRGVCVCMCVCAASSRHCACERERERETTTTRGTEGWVPAPNPRREGGVTESPTAAHLDRPRAAPRHRHHRWNDAALVVVGRRRRR